MRGPGCVVPLATALVWLLSELAEMNLKFILAGLQVLVFMLPCMAQEAESGTDETCASITAAEARRKFMVGFKAGVNRANVYDVGTAAFVASPHWGGVAGAWVCIPLGTYLGLQPEILLSQKGFEAKGLAGPMPYELTRTTTHLDVPVQLQLKPLSWFSLLGGIQYSFLLKQRDEFLIDNNYESVIQQFHTDDVRKNLMGLVAGLDLNVWHFVVSGRAGWDLVTNRGNGVSTTPRYKNLWIQGTLGYRIY